ncbi:MAG: TIGR02266 family protein [Deltaproteobacteria bacterium]
MAQPSDTVSLRITLRYKDLDEFVNRYAENISSAGLFLRTKSPKATGTKIRFELLLANGSRALRGEGVVVTVREDDKPGMALRFKMLDADSQAVIDRIVAKHGQGTLAPTPLSTNLGRPSYGGAAARPTSTPNWRASSGWVSMSGGARVPGQSDRTQSGSGVLPRRPARTFEGQPTKPVPREPSGSKAIPRAPLPRSRSSVTRPWGSGDRRETTGRIRVSDFASAREDTGSLSKPKLPPIGDPGAATPEDDRTLRMDVDRLRAPSTRGDTTLDPPRGVGEAQVATDEFLSDTDSGAPFGEALRAPSDVDTEIPRPIDDTPTAEDDATRGDADTSVAEDDANTAAARDADAIAAAAAAEAVSVDVDAIAAAAAADAAANAEADAPNTDDLSAPVDAETSPDDAAEESPQVEVDPWADALGIPPTQPPAAADTYEDGAAPAEARSGLVSETEDAAGFTNDEATHLEAPAFDGDGRATDGAANDEAIDGAAPATDNTSDEATAISAAHETSTQDDATSAPAEATAVSAPTHEAQEADTRAEATAVSAMNDDAGRADHQVDDEAREAQHRSDRTLGDDAHRETSAEAAHDVSADAEHGAHETTGHAASAEHDADAYARDDGADAERDVREASADAEHDGREPSARAEHDDAEAGAYTENDGRDASARAEDAGRDASAGAEQHADEAGGYAEHDGRDASARVEHGDDVAGAYAEHDGRAHAEHERRDASGHAEHDGRDASGHAEHDGRDASGHAEHDDEVAGAHAHVSVRAEPPADEAGAYAEHEGGDVSARAVERADEADADAEHEGGDASADAAQRADEAGAYTEHDGRDASGYAEHDDRDAEYDGRDASGYAEHADRDAEYDGGDASARAEQHADEAGGHAEHDGRDASARAEQHADEAGAHAEHDGRDASAQAQHGDEAGAHAEHDGRDASAQAEHADEAGAYAEHDGRDASARAEQHGDEAGAYAEHDGRDASAYAEHADGDASAHDDAAHDPSAHAEPDDRELSAYAEHGDGDASGHDDAAHDPSAHAAPDDRELSADDREASTHAEHEHGPGEAGAHATDDAGRDPREAGVYAGYDDNEARAVAGRDAGEAGVYAEYDDREPGAGADAEDQDVDEARAADAEHVDGAAGHPRGASADAPGASAEQDTGDDHAEAAGEDFVAGDSTARDASEAAHDATVAEARAYSSETDGPDTTEHDASDDVVRAYADSDTQASIQAPLDDEATVAAQPEPEVDELESSFAEIGDELRRQVEEEDRLFDEGGEIDDEPTAHIPVSAGPTEDPSTDEMPSPLQGAAAFEDEPTAHILATDASPADPAEPKPDAAMDEGPTVHAEMDDAPTAFDDSASDRTAEEAPSQDFADGGETAALAPSPIPGGEQEDAETKVLVSNVDESDAVVPIPEQPLDEDATRLERPEDPAVRAYSEAPTHAEIQREAPAATPAEPYAEAATVAAPETQVIRNRKRPVADPERVSLDASTEIVKAHDAIAPRDGTPMYSTEVQVTGVDADAKPHEEVAPTRRRPSYRPVIERESSRPKNPEDMLRRAREAAFSEEATEVPPERTSDEQVAKRPVDETPKRPAPPTQVVRARGPQAPSRAQRVVGIDFGGQWVRMGVIENAELELIPAAASAYIPALVATRKDGSLVTGVKARALVLDDPRRGTSPRSVLQAIEKGKIPPGRASGLNVIGSEDGEVKLRLGDHVVDLQDVLVTYFTFLRDAIKQHLGTDTFSVAMLVPDRLDPSARKMLEAACKTSRLDVARFVEESQAMLSAYNLRERPMKSVLLIDVGMTHVGIQVAKRNAEKFDIVASRWDDKLSAGAFDDRVVQLTLDELEAQAGEDHQADRAARLRLKEAVEHARMDIRRAASVELKVTLPAPGGASGVVVERSIKLPRSRIYQVTEDVVLEICVAVQEVLRDAGIDPRNLDATVLAGSGGTFPPLIEALTNLTQQEPMHSIPPAHVFAMGLAKSSAAIERAEVAAQPNTLSASIGFGLPGGRFRPILQAGSKLPITIAKSYPTTKDGQTDVELKFYQGDAEFVRTCTYLGELTLTGLPRAMRGEVRIDLELSVAADGILSIRLGEKTNGVQNRLQVATAQTPQERRRALAARKPAVAQEPPQKTGGFFKRLFGRK